MLTPDNWKEAGLGDLTTIGSGEAAPKIVGNIPVMGANGPIGTTSRANFNRGYIIGRVGAAGAVNRVDGPCWASDNTLTVVSNPDVCDHNYLGHLLRVLRLESLATKNAQPLVTQSNLRGLKLMFPKSLNEQRRIATILDTLDETIRKTKQVIAKLKQMKQGLLHDLLTKGIDENGELRDPERNPEQFKDSPLGRIPEVWNSTSVGSLAVHVGSGLTPRGGSNVYLERGVIFIRSQNVTFEGLKLDDVVFISSNTHRQMRRSEIYPFDVLINITGASIGRCCWIPEGLGLANVNQHVCAIRLPNPSEYDAVFLSAVLSSAIGQSQIARLNAGGNREGLNYQQLRSFMIPWPGSEEREQIAQIALSYAQRIVKEENLLGKLHSLKQGLMDDLLTGRVRVPVPEEVPS